MCTVNKSFAVLSLKKIIDFKCVHEVCLRAKKGQQKIPAFFKKDDRALPLSKLLLFAAWFYAL